MSIERPKFFEGQILSAADLTSILEYSRGQTARHERYLHLGGIAYGLELEPKEKKVGATTYQEITLTAGMSVDATGREIVVTEDELLSETDFDQSNVAIPNLDAWYPVFLVGTNNNAIQTPVGSSACGTSSPTRITEGHLIQFGRPGDELDWEKQTFLKVGDSPGSVSSRVLLGFVRWDANNPSLKPGRFTELDFERGRRYAGVQADVVAARGGNLELRNHTDIQAGKPALIIDEDKTDGPRLRFGLLTADGALTALFTVSRKGDVTAEGAISGAVTPGSVQIESGIATDGVILPLPPGITEDKVSNGKATLHIQVTPIVPGGLPPDANIDWVAIPHECQVDSTSRRVSCLIRWFRLGSPTTTSILPGACNYTVLGSVPATTGATP